MAPMLKPRHVAFWSARHDNGWNTFICEQPDGTFAVIAAPDTARGVSPDSIEQALQPAKISAARALEEKTGHRECSPQCGRWQKHSQLFMELSQDQSDAVQGEDEDGFT
jgi:hypothetical protein